MENSKVFFFVDYTGVTSRGASAHATDHGPCHAASEQKYPVIE